MLGPTTPATCQYFCADCPPAPATAAFQLLLLQSAVTVSGADASTRSSCFCTSLQQAPEARSGCECCTCMHAQYCASEQHTMCEFTPYLLTHIRATQSSSLKNWTMPATAASGSPPNMSQAKQRAVCRLMKQATLPPPSTVLLWDLVGAVLTGIWQKRSAFD